MIQVLADIEWQFKKSMAFDTYHHSMFRNEQHCIQWERVSVKSSCGMGFTNHSDSYFIDGIEKEFQSLDELAAFYNEKFIYEEDNPNQEVIYVKIIRNRIN